MAALFAITRHRLVILVRRHQPVSRMLGNLCCARYPLVATVHRTSHCSLHSHLVVPCTLLTPVHSGFRLISIRQRLPDCRQRGVSFAMFCAKYSKSTNRRKDTCIAVEKLHLSTGATRPLQHSISSTLMKHELSALPFVALSFGVSSRSSLLPNYNGNPSFFVCYHSLDRSVYWALASIKLTCRHRTRLWDCELVD